MRGKVCVARWPLTNRQFGLISALTQNNCICREDPVVPFEGLFELLEAEGFDPVDLELARPDSASARVAFLQHQGDVVADATRIGNANQANAHSQHLAFFKLVSHMKPAPALVATPEYSTPWSVIDALLNDGNLLPADGAIWM